MKIRTAELKTVCGYTSTLPESELPEIAFAGRSNVGKSSLINSLMQRKRLARVGETPGKTRTINFYEIDALMKFRVSVQDEAFDAASSAEKPAENLAETTGNNLAEKTVENMTVKPAENLAQRTAENMAEKPAGSISGKKDAASGTGSGAYQEVEESRVFQLVDLPGYGYANVSQAEKAKWGKMIERYLRSQRDLRAVFLLVDIRHAPNANDRQMYDWILQSGHTPVLIATKSDKIKRSQLSKQMKILREGLNAPKGSVILPFSALDGNGRDAICKEIASLLA